MARTFSTCDKAPQMTQQPPPPEEPSLIITIDTEEDQWGRYGETSYSVHNIDRLEGLQTLFDKYNIRPTYLISYPVATQDASIRLLSSIERSKRCELGIHCHPWNTPPLSEERSAKNSMLCNLPRNLQYEKLKCLKEVIEKNFRAKPTSFRAGRWGFNASLAQALLDLEVTVDSSITPHISWEREHGPNYKQKFPERYRIDLKNITQPDAASPLVEIPATTGFLGLDEDLGCTVNQLLDAPLARTLKLRGILARMRFFKMLWLCPETASASEMVALSKCLLRQGRKLLNLMFHSPTLLAGASPFVKTKADERCFLKRIEDYLMFVQAEGISSTTLSEAGKHQSVSSRML